MARRNSNVLLRVTGNVDDAKAALRDIRQDLRRMSREEARIRLDVQTERVKRQIQGVRNELEALSRKEASPRVELQTQRASERLRLLELRLDRLGLKRVQIDVDVKRGALERTAAGIGAVDRGIQGVARGFAGIFEQVPLIGGLLTGALSGAFSIASSLGKALGGIVTQGITTLAQSFSQLGVLAGPIGSVVGSVVSLGASLAGLAAVAGGIVIALNALAGAIIALGGALVALVASLGAAIAGFAALAVAFGAILIPTLIVGIGLFQRFAAVIKARKAREQELAQAVQAQKTAEEQRKAALISVTQAEQRLADTTVAGRKAMAQAAIDEQHAELGLEAARNGVQNARLGVLQARKDLKDLLAQTGVTGRGLERLFKQFTDVHVDPTKLQGVLGGVQQAGGDPSKVDPLQLAQAIQNVRNAELGVKQAVEGVGDANRTALEAEKRRADFAKRGLRAYQPYRQALLQVSAAEARLAKAQEKTTAAQTKYQHALHGLSDTEKGTLSRLDALVKGFTALAKAFSDPVFKALNDVFDSLKGNAGFLTAALVGVGRAFADVIRAFGRFLLQPGTRNAFTTMAAGAARLVRQLGAHAFISFLQIMTQIALTALPAVEAAARGVSGWLARIAGQPGRIHHAVQTVVAQFRVWAGLAGAVARLVIALFSAAAPAGRSLAASMTRIVNKWTEWIKANPERVGEFFRTAVRRAREIVHWLIQAFVWLKNHLPAAAETASNSFGKVVRAVDSIYKKLRAITELLRGDLSSAAQDLNFGQHLGNPPQGGKNDSFTKRFLKGLLGFQSGGVVPGIGRGDVMPAMLEPGEFVIRRAVASQIGLPALQSLNGGGVVTQPTIMPAGGDVHHHYHVPTPAGGGSPDPRSTLEHIQRLIQLKG